jgi:hypothetical protein
MAVGDTVHAALLGMPAADYRTHGLGDGALTYVLTSEGELVERRSGEIILYHGVLLLSGPHGQQRILVFTHGRLASVEPFSAEDPGGFSVLGHGVWVRNSW